MIGSSSPVTPILAFNPADALASHVKVKDFALNPFIILNPLALLKERPVVRYPDVLHSNLPPKESSAIKSKPPIPGICAGTRVISFRFIAFIVSISREQVKSESPRSLINVSPVKLTE